MSKRYLGEQIDIHGGEDLIFLTMRMRLPRASANDKNLPHTDAQRFLNIDNKKCPIPGKFLYSKEISENDLQVLRFSCSAPITAAP